MSEQAALGTRYVLPHVNLNIRECHDLCELEYNSGLQIATVHLDTAQVRYIIRKALLRVVSEALARTADNCAGSVESPVWIVTLACQPPGYNHRT